MKKLVFLLFFISYKILAQEPEPMATDRPDQTECANIVPIGFLQVENGFLIENDQSVNTKSKEIVYLTSLIKYGITKKFELRLIVENSKFTQNSGTEKLKLKGFNPIQLGFKVNIFHTKGLLPETSLIAHIGIPTFASPDKKQPKYSSNFRFTMQHAITEKASIAYNLGAQWDGETTAAIPIYTLTTSRSLGKKIGAYIELYGFLPKNSPAQHNFDGGFTFPLTNNFMLDISASKGLTEASPDNYVSLGLSFRVPK